MPSKSIISMFTPIYFVFRYSYWSRGMMNCTSLIICIDLLGDDLNVCQNSLLASTQNAVSCLHLQFLLWHEILSRLFSLPLAIIQKDLFILTIN